MSSNSAAFDLRDLEFRYPGALQPALAGITLSIPRGSILAIIGPNGSGKSTLLRLLLGSLVPRRGDVFYEGREVQRWDRREFARAVGVVTQREEIVFPLDTRGLVAMGRYPHLGPWSAERDSDRHAILSSMRRCAVEHLAERPLSTLSGGELQRARIARALAQEPRTLVLDEPTAALDIRHEMAIFELLASLSRDDGVTIVVVTHNLNLAARYAHRLLLLEAGRAAGMGSAAEVLRQSTLERVYGWPITLVEHPGPGPDTGTPQVVPLAGASKLSRIGEV